MIIQEKLEKLRITLQRGHLNTGLDIVYELLNELKDKYIIVLEPKDLEECEPCSGTGRVSWMDDEWDCTYCNGRGFNIPKEKIEEQLKKVKV
jgi:DnaJ-class molecular chaperone